MDFKINLFSQSFLLVLLIAIGSCRSKEKMKMFELLPSSATRIDFNNQLTETDSFNILTFEYIYNGAGVGVGDVNNDGLSDIFFAGNMVTSKLFLNKGGFKFEDITEKASVNTNVWCTGVAMIDINQDGLLDMYISTIQPNPKKPSVPNLLFLNTGLDNNGIPKFTEIAEKVGLADSSYSTHAAFLDYDLDGDLDMYLLNNALEDYNRNQAVGQKSDGTGKSIDKFFRNDGIKDGLPIFKDISRTAGILSEGWGLGIVVSDLNIDGYPDIYIANDFLSNDHLFINNKAGSFTNKIANMLKHQEHNGMGMDIADINNDGLNDIVVMDMMPDDNLRQKTMFSNFGYDRFMAYRDRGYQDQYIRNVLQLNNGNNTFSDIGYLSGIYATDWSWSSLLADFDNDGFRDLFVGNGYRKDITDQDFITYSKETAMFSTDKNRLNNIRNEVEKLMGVEKPNFLYRNNGDLTFTDKASGWGLDKPSYSNGAAYADFDNDGDLDLVTNNINSQAFLFKNNLINGSGTTDNKFLRIKLIGNKGNLEGLGTKISVYMEGKVFYAEHQLQRGYKSTVENFEHFGLGKMKVKKIDSVKITWQSGKIELLRNIEINKTLTIYEKNAVKVKSIPEVHNTKLFDEVNSTLGIHFKHSESDFIDFYEGQLPLPHKNSQDGPGITVGDINGDDLDDFIIGGSASKSAKIFYQLNNGKFKTDSLPSKVSEDTGLLLFDADNDGDQDLYCVSGSSEFRKSPQSYQDRFYRNSGKGKFEHDSLALPIGLNSGSCVVAEDFDKDGDLDLFVGGRVVPGRYPEAPESCLLINNGIGKFLDLTINYSKELRKPGMVTSALWTDVNNDGWSDIIMVGEWMPITLFINKDGKKFTKSQLPNTSGWWNSISGGDFDNDGDIDYIAGNLGLNSIYKASENQPVSVCAKDFDNNGTFDLVLCRYIQGKEFPVHPRETLTGQMPGLRNVLTRYSIYGALTLREIIPSEKRKDALVYKSTLLTSVYVENLGLNKFNLKDLPIEAQVAPIYGSVISDIDEDGNLDLLTIGNSYSPEPLSGFYDAGTGNFFKGDGRGNFKSISIKKSSFFVNGDAKALAQLVMGSGKKLFIATQNRDSVKVFSTLNSFSIQERIRAKPYDNTAIIELKNGKKRKQELYYGNGYLSSSSRTLIMNKATKKIIFVNNLPRLSVKYTSSR